MRTSLIESKGSPTEFAHGHSQDNSTFATFELFTKAQDLYKSTKLTLYGIIKVRKPLHHVKVNLLRSGHHIRSMILFPAAQLMDVKDTIIYGVEKETKIIVKGCCQLLVLYGKVSCLGFTLTAKSPNKFIKLPSPMSHSFLTLTTEEDSINEVNVENLQLSSNDLEILTEIISGTSCTVIFAAKPSYCKISRYLQKFHKNLFCASKVKMENTKQEFYRLSVDKISEQKQLVLSKDWKTCASQIYKGKVVKQRLMITDPVVLFNIFIVSPVIVICGGQNVGKSTFSKFLMNSYLNLNRNKHLWYVECDPGQSEFIYPGCVSLKLITSPVFGPAFMNLSTTTKNFFVGGVSVAVNPDLYISALEELLITLAENLKKRNTYPVIINTMGWSKGLGINLLVDVIRIFQPTHVIQLHSDSSRDLVNQITSSYLETAPGWRYSPVVSPKSEFEFIKISSAVSSECMNSSLFPPATKRSLVILAYLAKMQHNVECKPINYFAPFRVGFSKVFVKICHEDVPAEHLVSSLNGNLVALCCIPSEKLKKCVIEQSGNGLLVMKNTVACECLGLGVVRCIDEQSQHFYLNTPLSLSQLSNVNAIFMGKVESSLELPKKNDQQVEVQSY
ncbi:Polynucleotide 5'-hydroxyl-kinase NOL9 [Nymphon striatum]|nr:Polynucleotide 5'-hydroxyl-kinase NOL9 [Nymphon striatum]